MALVVSHSQRSTKVDPTSSLRDALQTFQQTLPAEQQKIFSQQHQTPEPTDVLKFVADLDANSQSRSGRCVASRVCTFLEAIQQFTGVVDTFVSSNPSTAALVWGTVKTALLIAGNAASYFDKITTMIMNVGRSCPVLAMFGPLYPNCVGLQDALCGYYSAIVKLCVKVVEVQQRTGIQHVWSSLINPFESEFKLVLEAIESAVQVVHLQISLASELAAVENSKLMELDRKSNEAFRLSSLKFRKDLIQEREDARVWRMRNAQRNADRMRKDIRDQLSSLDHLKPWKQAQRRRMASTAEWFQQDPVFGKWRDEVDSAILWCAGLMGAGKTIFASNVVSHLLRTRKKDEIIVHHFCQTDLETSLSAKEIIGTLARQILSPQLENIEDLELRALHDQCVEADVFDLVDIICSRIDVNKQYFILIDGLDECAKEDIEIVAASVAKICAKGTNRVKVVYVGRPGLEDYLFRQCTIPQHRLPVTKAVVTQDIETYIVRTLDQYLEDGRLKLGDETIIVEILETLKKQADGMFLWVYLFIDEICAQGTDEEVLQALRQPPRELSRLLDLKIARVRSSCAMHQAIKVLQSCGVAKRPLSVNELRELISISVGQDSLDVTRLPHNMGEIIDQCGGLVYVDEEDLSVQYVHHSVQQYLFSQDGPYQADFAKEEQDENLGLLALTYLHFKELGRQLVKIEKDTKVTIKPASIAVSSITDRYRKTGRVAQLLLKYQGSLKGLSKDDLRRKAQELAGQSTPDRLHEELANRQFNFLPYAQKYWIFHLAHSDMTAADRLKTGRLFLACINGGNDLAQRPWSIQSGDKSEAINETENMHDAVDWAVNKGHSGVFRCCVVTGKYVLSDDQKAAICAKVSLTRLPEFLDIIIERTKCLDTTWGKVVMLLATEARWDALVIVLDRVSGSLDFSNPNSQGSQCLHLATSCGLLEVVIKLLAAGVDVDAANEDGLTALHIAVNHCHPEVVNTLLSTNVNVNATDQIGETALCKAAFGGDTRIVEMLLSAGANCNAVSRSQRAPLSAAVRSGDVMVISILLRAGANIHAADAETGLTALHEAAANSNVTTVDRLLTAGADIEALDKLGNTALRSAALSNNTEVVDILLSAGSDVEVLDKRRWTALHRAAYDGYIEVIDSLIRVGADLDVPGARGWTALHEAAFMGHVDAVDRLLSAGCDIEALDDRGWTALHRATFKGYREVVERLLSAGANVHHVTKEGFTPLQIALECGKSDVADRLRDAGAVLKRLSESSI